ncbi:glycosyltransferase family A protein [Novosphingobium sp. TH158]|uniref:glycosyltransferase family 2 protein n=1 Tax=Novosphingobium sp. TH158 TaxID=2067455 RepID=UPI000C7A10CB|nr:glycosyltransferase family A protein [Novosphingobium sp. TH158]PLK26762.1 hypothetical protein C0V78_07565 [Novosphingobium sp. TH158]
MSDLPPGRSGQAVAVVMPVYNAQPYLDEAIASILAQTHADFTFHIYDDCSTDGSYERVLEWAAKDSRIRVSRGAVRIGPSASSNAAMAMTDAEFVARMDADDIAWPPRLELQAKALRDNPDAVMVGSTFRLIDAEGRVLREETPSRILGSAPPFAHPSIMLRKSVFDAIGGYSPESDYFEDADLIRRIATKGRILVYRQPLLELRFAGQNARLRDERIEVLRKIDRLYNPQRSASASSGRDGRPERISIMPFYSIAVLHILALQRPRLTRMILRHADLRDVPRLLAVLSIIAIANLSPRLARGISHAVSQLREWISGPRLGSQDLLCWAPPGQER